MKSCKSKGIIMVALLCLLASACSPLEINPQPTQTEVVPSTPTFPPTKTAAPTAAETAAPTETKILTATPTATEAPRIDEKQEIKPAFTEIVSQIFKGVQLMQS